MITIEEYFKDLKHIDESALVILSDKLWEIGTIEEIKQQVSTELFYLHIGMNLIGIWREGG